MSEYYLNPGLAQPSPDPLDEPYWSGLREGILRIQRCGACQTWQWGPEWICHQCHSDNMNFADVGAEGRIYSYERVWHPVHPVLQDQGPYIVVLVELPHAGSVRVVGNLLGDARQEVSIGTPVAGSFEHHADAEPAYTLLHWRVLMPDKTT